MKPRKPRVVWVAMDEEDCLACGHTRKEAVSKVTAYWRLGEVFLVKFIEAPPRKPKARKAGRKK